MISKRFSRVISSSLGSVGLAFFAEGLRAGVGEVEFCSLGDFCFCAEA